MTDKRREFKQYLDLLGIFHFVVAGLLVLFHSFFLVHGAIGIGILFFAPREPGELEPVWIGVLLIALSAVAVGFGWTLAGFMIVAGRRLRRRASRMFCLIVAGVECIFMPFGLVLGTLTIIVLTQEPAKEMFAANDPAAAELVA